MVRTRNISELTVLIDSQLWTLGKSAIESPHSSPITLPGGYAQGVPVHDEFFKRAGDTVSPALNALHMFHLDDMLEDLDHLQKEHEENRAATENVCKMQNELTEKMNALLSRVNKIRGKYYTLARYYRTQWCGMFKYAGALEDILRKSNIPLPCPPNEDGDLEDLFEEHDPPTLAGMCARWNMDRTGEELSQTKSTRCGERRLMADTGLNGPATPARKRLRS